MKLKLSRKLLLLSLYNNKITKIVLLNTHCKTEMTQEQDEETFDALLKEMTTLYEKQKVCLCLCV